MELLSFSEKHIEELEEARRMSIAEKFGILIQLYLVGIRLWQVRDREKKQKVYEERTKIDKENLKEFIRRQLSK